MKPHVKHHRLYYGGVKSAILRSVIQSPCCMSVEDGIAISA